MGFCGCLTRASRSGDASAVPSTEASAEAQALWDLFDLIVAALGGKTTHPRPTSAVARAVEEIRREAALAAAEDIIAALTPWALN